MSQTQVDHRHENESGQFQKPIDAHLEQSEHEVEDKKKGDDGQKPSAQLRQKSIQVTENSFHTTTPMF
jgi:predicted ATPase with chaperone activity